MLEKHAQTEFISKTYSTFWEKQVGVYGFTAYHQTLLSLLESFPEVPKGSKVLEVGIGTGFPFACSLSGKGYKVHGVDLAERLVRKCCLDYPAIHARVGDAEALPYGADEFALTYCLQSTWYFPRLEVALMEMFRVTQKPGVIVFDIINSLSPIMMYRHWIRKWFVERTAKAVLNGLATIAGKSPRYDLHLHESPSNPFRVERVLSAMGCRFLLGTPQSIEAGKGFRRVDLLNRRLVFICHKE